MSMVDIWEWTPAAIAEDMAANRRDSHLTAVRSAVLEAKVALQISQAQAEATSSLVSATDSLKKATEALGRITIIGALILASATIVASLIATA